MQTPTEHATGNGVPSESKAESNAPSLGRALLWAGVVGVTAAIAYVVARSVFAGSRAPADPTTQRIEALIDEANRLLRALEEQK